MKILDSYLGIEPFTVKVDASSELEALAEEARGLKSLPFPDKLQAVKKLSIGAMANAYEGMVNRNPTARDIVLNGYPLSYALQERMGCCRYQGALFFALGYEADLGDKQFVQAAPVNSRVNSVFNVVENEGKPLIVSIFSESLKDKSLDYSRQNPRIYEQAFESLPGYNMYSYHRLSSGLVIVENPERHVKDLRI
jgi:hypothetical protein